ncbi:MAG TPA: 3-hydroxyacyl-CoA dehydrogenase family protein, partial [Ramlibacter sp.]|nr:3-hydroxyacyl-CoA dehydrogenase family protein [Ramlibacter sp.]
MDEIAIAGPGLMGLGIAQVCAGAGFHVWLVGRNEASAQAGRKRLGEQLARQVDKGRMVAAEAAALLERIVPVREPGELARCAVGIESVPEDRAIKHGVLELLENSLAPGALIATNTSGLPVSGLAKALRRPARFLGLHFFSPVDRMALVEVVRGELTAQATLNEAIALIERLRKSPVVVRDGPGFFTSRVFAAYLDEAVAMVGEGVDVERIEQAGLALGRSIAPLALLDD